MTPLLTTVLATVIAVGLAVAVIAWAKAHARALNFAAVELEGVYESARQLVASEQTPNSVLSFMEYFVPRAGTPHLARSFAFHLISGGLRKPVTESARRFASDLDHLPPHLKESFFKMLVRGMLSSAASDAILWAPYLLAIGSFLSSSGRENDPPSPERATTVAADLAAQALAGAAA